LNEAPGIRPQDSAAIAARECQVQAEPRTQAVYDALQARAPASFPPIGVIGLDNRTFQAHVKAAVQDVSGSAEEHPGTFTLTGRRPRAAICRSTGKGSSMAKIIWRKPRRDDPIYRQGVIVFSPYSARVLRPFSGATPSNTAGPSTTMSGSGTAKASPPAEK
jgi:hypothetical protein